MRSRLLTFPVLVPTLLLLVVSPGAVSGAGQPTPPCPAESPMSTPHAEPVAAFPLEITDDAGRRVTFDRPPTRIVSIAPSNTEILFALGLGDRVVAVDTFSDYPPAATEKPRVGDYAAPDLERVVAAGPDLVLASTIHQATILPQLETLGVPTVLVADPANLPGVFAGIGLVGRLAGASGRAERLVCELNGRVEAVAAAVAGVPRTRVFVELGPELYTAGPGSFIHDLIIRAGGENIAAGAAEMWPQLSAEAVVAADPQVILLADHEAGVTPQQVAARPGWQTVSAVAQRRILPLDSDLVARPGPRVVDGLELIARAIHPDRFAGATQG